MANNLTHVCEQGKSLPLPTVSYGYSIFTGGARLDFSKLMKEADEQMYRLKKL